MGLFDNISSNAKYPGDPSKATKDSMVIQEVLAFAKLDLNTVFKMLVPAMVLWFKRAAYMWSDWFGHQDCNDQDRVLVERFRDQIPYMMTFLVKEGIMDSSIGDWIGEDQQNIIDAISHIGRPKGAHPCNELIHPARLLFTILFGVRITNSNFLDALDNGVDAYYEAAGWLGSDMPRIAVERAVALKQKYFPSSTYNTKQWDLNIFQRWPLVAPVPDPETPDKLFTGEFMNVNIVDGLVVGTAAVPDVQEAIKELDPNYVKPITASADTGSLLDKIISFVKTDPVRAAAVGAALWFAWTEVETND